MNKIILITLIVLGIATNPNLVVAWDDCPYGLVDDDGLCDHSQLTPEDREIVETSIEEVVIEPVIAASENPEKKPIKKLLPVIKLVIGHLVGILAYVGYRKYKLGKE